MKIFNWIMNRKLRPGPATECYSSLVPYPYTKGVLEDDDEIRRSVEKADTDALLLHQTLDGFLAIGTFGHGHDLALLPSIEEEEAAVQELQEEKEAVHAPADGNKPAIITIMPSVEAITGVELVTVMEETMRPSCEIKPLLEEEREKTKKRTTLADLLAADAAAARSGAPSNKEMSPEVASGGVSRALRRHEKCEKKHMLEGGGSPAPPSTAAVARKLHRLMARMLKKRIHPNAAYVRGASEDAGVAGGHGCLLY